MVDALRPSLFSRPSVELWLCSLSVSSRSEHRSSLDIVEGAGESMEDEALDRLRPPGETKVEQSESPGQVPPLLPGASPMRSIRTSWRWSSFRGMHSSRWLRSSAATVASIPGQLDTNMWTSCMHWMYPAANLSLASRLSASVSVKGRRKRLSDTDADRLQQVNLLLKSHKMTIYSLCQP